MASTHVARDHAIFTFLSGSEADTAIMDVVLGFAAGGTLGVVAVLIGSGCTWLNNRKDLKLRELDVREQEAKARILEAEVKLS